MPFSGSSYLRILGDFLSCPPLLAAFESFLREGQAHENLLFMEALARLECEQNVANIEHAVERIWKTFVDDGAPLEINITCRDDIKKAYDASKYTLLNVHKALNIFKKAEIEVTQLLETKVAEFKKNSEMSNFALHYPKQSQKKLVIIGGGFVGFTVASILDPMPRFHVTLIDAKDSFEYTPGMIKMLVRPEETTSSMRVRHDAYIKNGRIVIGVANRIEKDATMVHVNNESIPFDYLVIATGSTYQSKLKSFDISALYRMSDLSSEYNGLKIAKNILIVGGGLVGCELAAEIALHEFPDGQPKRKSVTLVESHSSLVRRSTPARQQKAIEYLRAIGVDVVCNEKIVDFDTSGNNAFLGSSGRLYKHFDKVYLATGTTPCCQILKQPRQTSLHDDDSTMMDLDTCVDNWDRICVKPTLQLKHWKYQHIFAGGDVTDVKEEKTGYAATLAGVCIARNICRMEKGKQPLEQGEGGTLPAPLSPLHGRNDQGGIGRESLSTWKKSFAFLHSNWAALKYFDESQFLQLVAGETNAPKKLLGRMPRYLDDLITKDDFRYPQSHHHPHTKDDHGTNSSVSTNLTGSDIISCAAAGCSHDSLHTTTDGQCSSLYSTYWKNPSTSTVSTLAQMRGVPETSCSPCTGKTSNSNNNCASSVRTFDTGKLSHRSLEDIYTKSVSEFQAGRPSSGSSSGSSDGNGIYKNKHHDKSLLGHHPLVATEQHPWQNHPFGAE
ncbi:unnamed protein product [Absidia cylindrospora]